MFLCLFYALFNSFPVDSLARFLGVFFQCCKLYLFRVMPQLMQGVMWFKMAILTYAEGALQADALFVAKVKFY